MRKDTIDKIKASRCCFKTKGKQHDLNDCRTSLCQFGCSPPHNQLICPNQRVQMMNLQANYQMIECDEQTAQNHHAMAEMEGVDDAVAGDEVDVG